MKRDRLGFVLHQISHKLYESQRVSICFMTDAFLVAGFPPVLSFWESGRLKSPPIIILSRAFRDCHFVKIFIQRVINWFNIENRIKFNPSSEERLFGILSGLHEKVLVRKFNYTMLFIRYYIYANKLHNKPILLQDFVDKMIIKYRIEML